MNSTELIKEIKVISKKIKPDYSILIMPADIGQAAKTQAEEFQKALNIDGVIITRMDGTGKAGTDHRWGFFHRLSSGGRPGGTWGDVASRG